MLNFILQLSSQNIIYPDSQNYFDAAQNLFLFHRGHPYRPVLMSFISGLPFLFTQSSVAIFNWSFVINVLCWLGSVLLLFSLSKHFLKPKFAFLMGLSFMLCIGNFVIVYHLLAESIFTFMLLLFLFYLKKYFDTQKFAFLSIAISILVLSMLLKPASKFIAILVVLFFIKILIKHFRAKAMLFIYCAISLVIVQVAGLKYQFGNYTISYIDVVTYHNYICSKAKCIENGLVYKQEDNPRADYLFSFDSKTQAKIAKADLKEQLYDNKINLIKAYTDNLVENSAHGSSAILDLKNHKNTTYFDFFSRSFYLISAGQNLFLTFTGLIFSVFFIIRNFRKDIFYAFVSLICLYIILVSGISSGQGDRFHLVAFPFVLLLIAKFLVENSFFKLRVARLQK